MKLTKLLDISSDPLGEPMSRARSAALRAHGHLGDSVSALLERRNGFYAFESALHVFPLEATVEELDLEAWNSPTLWRDAYGDMAEGLLFFAEDAFGGQFCLGKGAICTFDPETGAVNPMADDIEDWASEVLADYRFLTGYPLAHEWQMVHGRIPPRRRLIPRVPFVLGGQFALENLYAGDAVQAMRFRGLLATKIRDLPDGEEIEIEIVK